MGALWRWISFRHLFQEAGRTLLTLAGVALGVAVFVSIRLANHSAMASFSDTVDAVAGRANLQISGDSEGFDERLFPRVLALRGVEAAAPVIQTYARAAFRPRGRARIFSHGEQQPYDETLLILGIDVFSEGPFGRFSTPGRQIGASEAGSGVSFLIDPHGAAITRTLAQRHGLRRGDPLQIVVGGRPVTLKVRLILDSEELQQAMGGNVVLLDIAVAQEVFHRWGKLDRIDLLVPPARREAVKAEIRPLLPPQVIVGQPQARTQQVENMVRAFALNLTALSFIALFVSMFLIFNAVSTAVLRRRREIGILRSLGLVRRGVLLLFLAEAAFLGALGGAAGLGLGTLLARATLGSIARTLTTLYLVVHAEHLYLDPAIYLLGFGLGLGMSLLSALAPAVEASLTPPSVTVRQGTLVEAQPIPLGRITAGGLATLLLAAGVTAWTVGARRPEGGFVSAFLLLMGFSLLSPGFTLLCERALAGPVRALGGVEGVLGIRYLREAVARASVVVAALMVSVAMLVALSIMVGSFRKTVDVWVNQTLRGDLYVQPVGRDATGGATVLPPEVVRAARNLPGVMAVDTYRGVDIPYGDRLVHVAGVDFEIQEKHGRLQFLHGDSSGILRRARLEDGVVVTESFAFRHRSKAGDSVTLNTPSGTVSLPIEGVFYDYSTDAGALMMDYHLFQRLWRDLRTENVALYLEPGVDPVDARNRFIRSLPPDLVLYVTTNQKLRARVLTVFDQTFQITYALQTISILVAVLGVIDTLTALILQRGREIGVLRATGALRRQVGKMVLVESGLLGLIGSLLGCVCGVALSLLLVYVINKQFFGWSIRLTIDPRLFLGAIGMMVVASLLAGIAPARLAASRLAAEAMRVE